MRAAREPIGAEDRHLEALDRVLLEEVDVTRSMKTRAVPPALPLRQPIQLTNVPVKLKNPVFFGTRTLSAGENMLAIEASHALLPGAA